MKVSKRNQRRANARLLTIVSKLEKLNSDAAIHGFDIPHGLDNAVQAWFCWLSEKQAELESK